MKQVWKYVAFSFCLLAFLAVVPCSHAETIDSYGSDFIAITNFKPDEKCVITALFEPTVVFFSNGTHVRIHRGEKYVLSSEQWVNEEGTRARTLFIHANEPIRVEHTTSFGDSYVSTLLPSLSCESSTEQQYIFSQKTSKPTLFIITRANDIHGFVIDGKVLKSEHFYGVNGNDHWAYAVIELGTRKAGSTLTISAPHSFHAAVVANTYQYLSECALEASVSIDTLHSDPQYAMHTGPLMMSSSEMNRGQNTGSLEALENENENEDEEEEDLDKELEEMMSTSHRGVLYLQGAYTGMPLKMSGYSTSMGEGYGAAAGALYEFQKRTFLLQTGAGFYWLDRRVNILDQPAPNRYDRDLRGGIEIPLMVGQNFTPVYYLLGIKIGIDIMGKQKSVCSPNTVSPASSATPTPAQTSQIKPEIRRESDLNMGFGLDPRLSAEFGFNLGPERNEWVLSRLAVFADWGFYPMNMSRVVLPDDTHPVSTTVGDPNDYATYNLTHFMNLHESYGSAGCFLHHFQVGLKFTLVLGE